MQELHVASNHATVTQNNAADFVFDNARTTGQHVALRRRVGGAWTDVTAAAFGDEVTDLARGLIAAGVGAGDRVAVMSKTRYEWTLADIAVLAVGGVVVPIYETSSAEQVQWILSDADVSLLVVETSAHVATVAQVRDRCPALREVLVIDDGALRGLSDDGAGAPAAEVARRRGLAGAKMDP